MSAALGFRSLLFVPANDAGALAAAYAGPADAVVADLEDPVPEGEKQLARDVVADLLPSAATSAGRLLRVNVLGGELAARDLELAAAVRPDALVVPHATPERLALLPPGGCPVVAVVESAAGVRAAYEIASHPRVQGLALGAWDLGAELRLEPRRDGQELLYARSKLVVDAVAAGRSALFDRVCPHDALPELEADALLGRQLGYRGKSTTTPAHVETINRVFAAGER